MVFIIGKLNAWDASGTDGLNCKGYSGVGSDGDYLYYTPFHNGSAYHGIVLRQKIYSIFKSSDSWEAFNAGSVDGLTSTGFYGNPIFDGRFMYFVPYNNGSPSGIVLRYDTTKPFKSAGSWEAYDAGSVDGLTARGFHGAVFDGQFIYFVPFNNGAYHGIVLRYDTSKPFKSAGSWEAYNASDYITLNTASGHYVDAKPGESVMADQHLIGDWEIFKRYDLGGGNVALQAADGHYLSAVGREVKATTSSIGAYETFLETSLGGALISLKAANNRHLVADHAGGQGLFADQILVGNWETFTKVDLGSGYVALRTYDGVHYASAKNGGNDIVMSDQFTIEDWRAFRLCDLGGGYVALQVASGKFLSAASGGNLISTSESVGANETFKLTIIGGSSVALQSADGHYLTAVGGGGGALLATATSRGSNETFTLTRVFSLSYYGAVKQDNFIYFSPFHDNISHHGRIMRYDITKPFKSPMAWEWFDVAARVDGYCKGLGSPCTDGQFIYFPNKSKTYKISSNMDPEASKLVRYDTTKPFKSADSYETFNILDLCDDQDEQHDSCCTLKEHYIIFTPSAYTILAYDTEKPFHDSGSWSQKDISIVDELDTWGNLGGYADPNYVYFAPYAGKSHGTVLRGRIEACPAQEFPTPGHEDLSEYIIDDYNDSTGYLSVTPSRVTAVAIEPCAESLLLQDYEKDCFDGFVINFDLKFSSAHSATPSPYTDAGFMCLFSLSNKHSKYDPAWYHSGDPCVIFWMQFASPPGSPTSVKIMLCKDNSYGSSYSITLGTIYYCTISRTAGSGTITLRIYSDAARTTLLATLTEMGFPTDKKWRFIYAMRGCDSEGEWYATYWLENLNVVSYG